MERLVQHLLGYPFHYRNAIADGFAPGQGGTEGGGRKPVEAIYFRRSAFFLQFNQVIQLHQLAGAALYVQAPQVQGLAPVLPGHLPNDLVLLAAFYKVAEALTAQAGL